MRFRVCLGLFIAAGCRGKPEDPPGPPAAEIAPAGGAVPLDLPGIHNAFRVSGRVYSGGNPDGDAAFAALQKLGIKTVVSVDGATPDADAARRHGLRYVHLPFGYDGIPRERVLALVKAATDLPGPIYVHCHHGKHRGPAAVAVIQLCTDPAWDAGRAEAWLKAAGTDARYTGLVGLPRSLLRPTAAELASAVDLPAATAVPDLTRLMVGIDHRWDELKLAKASGWAAPEAHPDVTPAHAALQLVEHYREAARLDAANRRGPPFHALLADAKSAASALEAALRAGDTTRAASAFARSAALCTACHAAHRDHR